MSEHVVQLFDTPESLADTVASYLAEGIDQGDTLLVVATPRHWASISERLDEVGQDHGALIAAERLVVLDAAATLARCSINSWPRPELFDAAVGTLVRQLAARGPHLRIYGEMVNLLARDGDLKAAERLEACWNVLAESERFTLLCGYEGTHFGHPRTRQMLERICASHSRVRVNQSDPLSSWLLTV